MAYLSEKSAAKLSQVGTVANRVFFSFIKWQMTECVILGILCYIGMRILGLEYALLISFIVALGALIPILGAYIGCITGVVILLLVHPIDALIFLVFLLCLQQVEGNLIYPRVVGSSTGCSGPLSMPACGRRVLVRRNWTASRSWRIPELRKGQ